MSQNASSVDGDGVGEIRAGGAHDAWQCSRRAPAAHHCGSRLSPGGRWVASICGCSLMQIALYHRSNPHIFTVVSMYKALTAVVVTLLAIGSAQAQRSTESLLDNGQAASRGNMNARPYDQHPVANPYSPVQNPVANPYSPDSTNHPYGAGSQHRQDSPSHFGFRWAPD